MSLNRKMMNILISHMNQQDSKATFSRRHGNIRRRPSSNGLLEFGSELQL